MPTDLHREHNKGHNQVSYTQVHDEKVHSRFTVAMLEEDYKHGQVSRSCHNEKNGVGDYGHQTVSIEDKLPRNGDCFKSNIWHLRTVNGPSEVFHDNDSRFQLLL